MKWSKRSEVLMSTVLLLALILAGTLWWLADQQGLEPPACLQKPVGVWGPIKLSFKEPMQMVTVVERVNISPNLAGHWSWDGLDLLFWPQAPMGSMKNGDDGIAIQLKAGAQNLKGKSILKDFSCVEAIRNPKIVYEAVGQQHQGDLIEISEDGSGQKTLAQFSSSILSFVASRDGEFLVVSVQNRYEGSDLWMVDRDKGTKNLLMDCKQDHCENAVWSPDGREVAYDRMVIDPLGPQLRQPPQVWRIHLPSRANHPLVDGKNNTGQFPQYSPDGQKIAYFDLNNKGIHILSLDGTDDKLIKTNSTYFSWSPDSTSLLYFGDVVELESLYMNTYIYHVATHQSELLLNEYKGQFEFGRPIWSPDGNWITLAARLVRGGMSQQLVMLRVDGSDVKNITDTQVYTHSSYHWNPDGTWLIYQRLELGTSSVTPQIFRWNRITGETKQIVDGGSMPDWLP
jgi:Tol biopolymer transport system component